MGPEPINAHNTLFISFADWEDPYGLLGRMEGLCPKMPWLLEVRNTFKSYLDYGHIKVRTSGSTGKPSWHQFEKPAILNSIRRSQRALQLEQGGDWFSPLPCSYIGGKMMLIRAFELRCSLLLEEPSTQPQFFDSEIHHFAAFSPMMWNSVCQGRPGSSIVILGGGAVSQELEDQSRDWPNVYNTYGMTETLSHIALRRLNRTDFFRPLEGIRLRTNNHGALIIESDDFLCETNDLVEWGPQGTFKPIGRLDNVINSGGVKLQAEEIEAFLEIRNMQGFLSYFHHPQLGQAAVWMALNGFDLEQWNTWSQIFKPLKCIKYFCTLQTVPRTETNKVSRRALQEWVEANPDKRRLIKSGV